MIKIACLFERDFAGKKPVLLRTVTPGCGWVLEGEGAATRKRDGTACLVRGGKLFKRFNVKKRAKETRRRLEPSPVFHPPIPSPDTGPTGWRLQGTPDERWHMDAWLGFRTEYLFPGEERAQRRNSEVHGDGTYELLWFEAQWQCGKALESRLLQARPRRGRAPAWTRLGRAPEIPRDDANRGHRLSRMWCWHVQDST